MIIKKILFTIPLILLLATGCNSSNQTVAQNTSTTQPKSVTPIALESPDKSKVISYDNYNGYASPQKPAAVFVIKDKKTGQQQNLPYFIAAINTGRGIEEWYWIDNRYVLISGDGAISILDTVKLESVENLIGINPKLSKDNKILTYTELEPPLYGPDSGKTHTASILLPR